MSTRSTIGKITLPGHHQGESRPIPQYGRVRHQYDMSRSLPCRTPPRAETHLHIKGSGDRANQHPSTHSSTTLIPSCLDQTTTKDETGATLAGAVKEAASVLAATHSTVFLLSVESIQTWAFYCCGGGGVSSLHRRTSFESRVICIIHGVF